MKRVIAKLKLGETALRVFKRYTQNLVEKSRAEDGNISYDLYQDVADKSVFLFIETYRNQEAVDLHFESEYLADFLARVNPLLREEPEVLIDTIY